mmetsp:Transcript_69845/g.128786  ORF Transcript_69845/g.128786 Transcript_69845/m.128786 type:complete len:548 (-) Transcript_69845:55-1698(-)
MLTPHNLLHPGPIDNTEYPMEARRTAVINKLAPTQTSYARTNRCLQQLQAIVRRLGPAWVVVPFGSTANGFGTVHSDLDVTCCVLGQVLDGDIQKQAAWVLSSQIVPMIKRHDLFLVKEEVLGARVPIVKLRFEGSLDVDLSCHNLQPLLNTRLLRAYSRMDWKVKHFGLAVKFWAKGSQVCDASKAHLSSYTFTLLMLYFLQVHPAVLLPVLPVEAFQDYASKESVLRVRSVIANWVCLMPLPELLVRFFEFYSNHDSEGFDWGAEVVSVRTGIRGKSTEPIYSQLRGRDVNRLHVEDPYQIERNLNCVLGKEEEYQLRTAFTDAFNDITNGKTPIGLQCPSESCLAASSPPIYDPISKGQSLLNRSHAHQPSTIATMTGLHARTSPTSGLMVGLHAHQLSTSNMMSGLDARRSSHSSSSGSTTSWQDASTVKEPVTAEATGNASFVTLMFCNIPCKLSLEEIVAVINDAGFHGKYQFVYVPTRCNQKGNRGYAFIHVNDHSSEAFCSTFSGYQWRHSTKVGSVKMARVQGYHPDMKTVLFGIVET